MKPNKYAKATIPEPKVLVMPKGTNRKDRRKLLLGWCPCGSGKKFFRCCLPKEKKRREELAKERVKAVDKDPYKNVEMTPDKGKTTADANEGGEDESK